MVRINGRDVYLGRHGSPESQEKYRRIIAEWHLSGAVARSAPQTAEAVDVPMTVGELILLFWRHAETYYRRRGGQLERLHPGGLRTPPSGRPGLPRPAERGDALPDPFVAGVLIQSVLETRLLVHGHVNPGEPLSLGQAREELLRDFGEQGAGEDVVDVPAPLSTSLQRPAMFATRSSL